MDPKKIGKLISTIRKEKDLTQDELAEKVGVNGRTISKWERGINLPAYDNLEYLSIALDVTLNELMNGEKNLKSDNNDKILFEGMKYYINFIKKKYFFIVIFLIFFLSAIFFGIFFFNNYNRNKLYTITTLDNDYLVNGYLVFNQEQNLIIISNISYQGDDLGTIDEPYLKNIKVFMLADNKEVFAYVKDCENEEQYLSDILNNITIVLDDDKKHNSNIITYDSNIENIKLKVEYLDTSDNIYSVDIPLNLNEKFANNRLVY